MRVLEAAVDLVIWNVYLMSVIRKFKHVESIRRAIAKLKQKA